MSISEKTTEKIQFISLWIVLAGAGLMVLSPAMVLKYVGAGAVALVITGNLILSLLSLIFNDDSYEQEEIEEGY